MTPTCPKCGSSTIQSKYKSLLFPFTVEYLDCGNGYCDWSDFEEKRDAIKAEHPEWYAPIRWAWDDKE